MKNCQRGKACGNACIAQTRNCRNGANAVGNGIAPMGVLCTQGRSKPCGNSCIRTNRNCNKPVGSARFRGQNNQNNANNQNNQLVPYVGNNQNAQFDNNSVQTNLQNLADVIGDFTLEDYSENSQNQDINNIFDDPLGLLNQTQAQNQNQGPPSLLTAFPSFDAYSYCSNLTS
jgi:hypothetical protein